MPHFIIVLILYINFFDKNMSSFEKYGAFKGTGHVVLCHILQENNLSVFLFAFLHTKPILKMIYSKRKKMLPEGAKSVFKNKP